VADASTTLARMPRRTARVISRYALLVALLVLLGAVLLYPILLTVRGGFAADPATGRGFTLEHVSLVLKDPRTLGGLLNAGGIAVLTTVVSIGIALPLAFVSARYRFPGKPLWNAAILVPLVLPPFVGALGVRALLGRAGAINGLLGMELDVLGARVAGVDMRLVVIALVEALHLYPIIYLNAVAALANLDPALEEAAENLGAGPWRRFGRITLPLIRPGLFAGSTIVFIWSLTELGTPLIFDYQQVTPVQIFNGLKEVETSARPYALTVLLLFAAVGSYVVGRVLLGRRGHAMYSKAARAGGERTLPRGMAWTAAGGFAAVTVVALLPHLGVILTSVSEPGSWYRSVLPRAWTLEHYGEALGSDMAFGSIVNSLKYSALAVGFDLVIGLGVAYIVVRTTLRGRNVLDALCMLPLAVPGLVMAFGYVALTLRWPFERPLVITESIRIPAFLDGTWLDLSVLGARPNPLPLLVVAYAVRRLPYIVRSAVAGLEQTSGELEEAAINLGASRLRAVRSVIVPLITANLIAGALLVFSFSMLEVSDSLILAQQKGDYPITKAIYAFTARLGDGPYIASAMGVWGMALLATTLVGASLLLGRRLGAIFRA